MRKLFLSVFAVFILLFSSACNQDDATTNEAGVDAESNESASEGAELQTEYPYTVTDLTGTEIVFEKEPERIVSVSTSDTEILFALGLDERIYGVSDFDNFPEAANDKPKMGGVVEPNIEAILAQEPDLIVTGTSISPDVVEKIRELDLIIYQSDAKNTEEILASILEMGKITNKQSEAEALVADMKEKIESIKEKVAEIPEEEKKSVYIEYNPGWTVGAGEYMTELIEMAGGINIAADESGWIQVNEEKIIQDDPEVILHAANLVDHDTGMELSELIKERSGWEKITAIQEDRLVPIDEDIMSRNGPRIVELLQIIAEGIYPELFE
ncbi:ABC transporter substrate-binding protein [Oceanobacillus sp. CAU 1775]